MGVLNGTNSLESLFIKEDGVATETSIAQSKTEASVYHIYKAAQETSLLKTIKLNREEHIDYVLKGLKGLEKYFVGLDASKPWLCYWMLHSLDLLGHKIDKNLIKGGAILGLSQVTSVSLEIVVFYYAKQLLDSVGPKYMMITGQLASIIRVGLYGFLSTQLKPWMALPIEMITDTTSLNLKISTNYIRKKSNGKWPTKPPNSFILYRIAYSRELKLNNVKLSIQETSKLVSNSWDNEKKSVKTAYKNLAVEIDKKLLDLRNENSISDQDIYFYNHDHLSIEQLKDYYFSNQQFTL
ncbi:3726_t:CDS:2 [Entrophospora sp. SA101]|nr:3726_t:CDS:2 [Entrophospora sp. SA101]